MASLTLAPAPLPLYRARLSAGRMANAIGERWLLGHMVGRFESQGSPSLLTAAPPRRTIAGA